MESKVPFIAEYDPYSTLRPLKRHRPPSTRPWTLSLFLAATGICFGLLLALTLIEKDPEPILKRDVNHIYRRHVLSKRQDSGSAAATTTITEPVATTSDYLSVTAQATAAASSTIVEASTASATDLISITSAASSDLLSIVSQCTDYATAQVTLCEETSGYSCPPDTTVVIAPSTTDTCITSTVYETVTVSGQLLSITSQCTTTATRTIIACDTEIYACPTTTASSAAAAATTGSCVTVTETAYATVSAALLSITSQCTDTTIESVTTCIPASGYVCPTTTPASVAAAATTGTCSTTTLTVTVVDSGSLLSVTSQPPTSSSASALLSVTSQPTTAATPTTVSTSYPAVSQISDGDGLLSVTFQDSTVPLAASSTSPVPIETSVLLSTSDGAYLSVTAQSTISRCTVTAPPPAPVTVYICPNLPDSVCPASMSSNRASAITAATVTGTCTTIVPIPTTITQKLLSITSEDPSDGAQVSSETGLSSAASGASLLSIVSQGTTTLPTQAEGDTAATSSYISVTYPTTDVFLSPDQLSVTSGSATLSTDIAASTTSLIGPFANPVAATSLPASESTTAFVVYTLTLQDSTQTLSFSSGEEMTVAAASETYLIFASSDEIQTSAFTGSASPSSLNQGGSLTRTDSPYSGITSMPTGSAATLTTTASSSTSTNNLNTNLGHDLVLVKLSTFHPYYYFLATYLPKILAVIMATLWGVIFAGLKLMEPFYQLSAPTGAFASDAMFGNYLASEISPLSLSATFRGQWVLLLGGGVMITWAAIVALVSESMGVISQGRCNTKQASNFRCDPAWAVSPTILNILLVLTGLAFLLTLVLMLILSQRKRTSCYHDPSSIAAMAELLGNPHVMEDFRAIKPSSSIREVKLLLGDNRYKIGLYDRSSGKEATDPFSHSEPRWGLIKIEQASIGQKIANRRLAGYSAVLNPSIVSMEEEKANRKRRIWQLIYDLTMLLVALCVFALVLGYFLDKESDPFNDFFNSSTFGPRFVVTCLALILALGWRRTSQEMTVMAPYRSMARAFTASSGVMANRSILVRPARTPWVAIYRGLRHRYYMVTIVATCAASADILLIAVSGVPYGNGQTYLSLWVSSLTSMAILGIMILTSIAVIIYNRTSAGGTRKLPRSPDTLLGVWLYLCHSKLVITKETAFDDFPSPLNNDQLIAKYEQYQCGFTRKEGRDRVHWWTIDSITGLQSEPIPAMPRPYPHYHNQYHVQPDPDTDQARPQPYEASATPIENPYGYFPPQSQHQTHPQNRPPPMHMQRTVPPDTFAIPQRQHRQEQDLPFEAQAKTPVTQDPPHITSTSTSAFEAIRPQRHILKVIPAAAAAPTPAPAQNTRRMSLRKMSMRGRAQYQYQPQAQTETQVQPQPQVQPQIPTETTPSLQETLAAAEYEQEFYGGGGGGGHDYGYGGGGRRTSAGSSIYSGGSGTGTGNGGTYQRVNNGIGNGGGNTRWTNDGRSQYRFD